MKKLDDLGKLLVTVGLTFLLGSIYPIVVSIKYKMVAPTPVFGISCFLLFMFALSFWISWSYPRKALSEGSIVFLFLLLVPVATLLIWFASREEPELLFLGPWYVLLSLPFIYFNFFACLPPLIFGVLITTISILSLRG